ncbi:MAG: Holliday junction resolvase RuvX [Gammaproteobacteria bacterium]|nr:MAG: Holliday junction resolvase RuvX [Gammaproteobacteria bacterium]
MAEQVVVLAFDFGLKRIGVAVGQSVTGTASPETILSARDGQPDWHEVAALLETWQPQQLVVGLPLNMDGTDTSITPNARKFAKRLHGRFGLPVDLVDERLTTREVRHELDLRGGRRQSVTRVDALAAVVILESWFAQQAEKEET